MSLEEKTRLEQNIERLVQLTQSTWLSRQDDRDREEGIDLILTSASGGGILAHVACIVAAEVACELVGESRQEFLARLREKVLPPSIDAKPKGLFD